MDYKKIKPELNIAKASAFLLISRLKHIVNAELLDMGILPQLINIHELIPYVPIRNILIKQEFKERQDNKEKANKICCDIALKYNLEYKTIESIVYSK